MNAPSGFWRRYAAYSLDCTVLCLLALPLLMARLHDAYDQATAELVRMQERVWELMVETIDTPTGPMDLARGWAADPGLRASFTALSDVLTSLSLAIATTLFLLGAIWFIATESSSWQASPGKRLLGLRVTDLAGQRCDWRRTSLRFVAGVPSWLLLNLGHAMAAWTPGKRALHDYVAGTRVELAPGAPATMPRWARSWLLLQVAAFFGLIGFVVLRYVQLLWDAAAGNLA